jgi:antitoxin HicB
MMTMTEVELDAKVAEIVARPYHRVISGAAEEGYLGEVPELPGCYTAGESPEEALHNLDEAMALWLEVALLNGDSIPEPARALHTIA